MKRIKDIEPSKIDSTMSAIASVLKAVVQVAKCFDSFKQKDELTKNTVV